MNPVWHPEIQSTNGHPPEAVVETSHPLLANVPARVHSIIFRPAAGHSVPKE